MEMLVIFFGLVSFAYPHSYDVQVDETYARPDVNFPYRLKANLFSNYTTPFLAGPNDNPCKGACSFQTVFAIVRMCPFVVLW